MKKSSDKSLAQPELTEGKPDSKSGKEIKVSPKKDNEKGIAASSSAKAKKVPKE